MSNLEDFVIEENELVEYVGDGGDVIIPEGVTRIGESAFECCDSLTSVSLADSVTSIGDYAFSECQNLDTVIINDNVPSISYYAFHLCTGLTSVTIGKNITNIKRSAFELCHDLRRVYYNGDIASWCNIDFDEFANPLRNGADLYIRKASGEYERVENLVIPDTVQSIGYEAFCCCTSLSNVTIGNGVTQILTDAFYGSSLTTLTIADRTKLINPGAFAECEVKTVILGSGLQRIYQGAFYGCWNLERIFYYGTKSEFEKIELGEDFPSEMDEIYYYSEETPLEEGRFWHYVDGVATTW